MHPLNKNTKHHSVLYLSKKFWKNYNRKCPYLWGLLYYLGSELFILLIFFQMFSKQMLLPSIACTTPARCETPRAAVPCTLTWV